MSKSQWALASAGAALIGLTPYLAKSGAANNPEPVLEDEFTILTVNDIYELEAIEGLGGIAELSSLLQQERVNTKNCITTVNGDFMVATSLSNITKGAHMIDLFNALGMDLAVFGNHEFDFGPEETVNRIKESEFIWLGTNVFEKGGTTLFAGCKGTHTKKVGPFTIGFFGLCTHETVYLSHPDETVFAPVEETAERAVKELKGQGCDVIVAITHQAIVDDRQLARNVKGIDVIIGGHDHSPFSEMEGQTLIHKSGVNSEYLGRIDLVIQKKDGKIRVIPSYKLILNRGYPADPAIIDRINKHMESLNSLKSQVIAQLTTELDSRTANVRISETSMGDLATDAIRATFNTEVAIVQGGAVRGNMLYPANSAFTRYDLTREFPFPNSMTAYKLKGKDLKKGLEEGMRSIPNRSGSFPQVSGVKMVVERAVSGKFGGSITRIQINGKDLEPEREYSVVSTEFIRKGGDGYQSLEAGEVIKHPLNGSLLYSAVEEYFVRTKVIVAPAAERILFI